MRIANLLHELHVCLQQLADIPLICFNLTKPFAERREISKNREQVFTSKTMRSVIMQTTHLKIALSSWSVFNARKRSSRVSKLGACVSTCCILLKIRSILFAFMLSLIRSTALCDCRFLLTESNSAFKCATLTGQKCQDGSKFNAGLTWFGVDTCG